ncbi:serpin B [Schistosoma bovis]|uniref:Serpin B n=1 Tax=Schistosoma bovis TaxID=6184 RepID=A0A430Q0J8_SCHBO|nr:serpin B [Schistosoma bovis]
MLLRMCLGQWENVFLSPFNIYTALGMVLSGSGNNTKAEMTKAMQLSDCLEHDQVHHEIAQLLNDCSKPSEGVNIILANRLFVAQNVRIKEQFKTNLKTYYDAPTEHVAFETDIEGSRNRINQWVSEQTKGQIQELLSPGSLTKDTSAVVTATTYFKGLWNMCFPEDNSHTSEFYELSGSKMSVKLMYNESYFDMVSLPHLRSRAAKIPFKDPKFTLLIILPDANDGLPDLLDSMYKHGGVSSILSTSFQNTKMRLYLPKFRLREGYAIKLKDHLRKLGINDAFCPLSADFSNVSDSDRMCISDVMHKAVFEVDEKGAVAAAATTIITVKCAAVKPYKPVPEFRVDHPFFISIVWNNCLPIFLGHITSPLND